MKESSFDSSENVWLDHAVFRIRDILERIKTVFDDKIKFLTRKILF